MEFSTVMIQPDSQGGRERTLPVCTVTVALVYFGITVVNYSCENEYASIGGVWNSKGRQKFSWIFLWKKVISAQIETTHRLANSDLFKNVDFAKLRVEITGWTNVT